MRGEDEKQDQMFSYVRMEDRIPTNHPLRHIREMTDFVLERMSRKFAAMYAKTGRPSIPPEQLLRALVLQSLYSIRSERMLVEQLNYNLLFRWFVGLNADDPVWSATVFSKNRDRFLKGDVSQRFFREVIALARNEGLMSSEHFTVDGTLIESLASLKSFRPVREKKRRKDDDPGNPTVNFHGQKRGNNTHRSTTDPESRLYRKGNSMEARLYFTGHVLMENRNGLIADCCLRQADGFAEREAAVSMLRRLRRNRPGGRITVGADKAYDTAGFVAELRALGMVPHVAQNTTKRRSRIDARTTRHPGYAISQRHRKKIEEGFGWLKTIGLIRRSRFIGRELTEMAFMLSSAVYNMIRVRTLLCAQ